MWKEIATMDDVNKLKQLVSPAKASDTYIISPLYMETAYNRNTGVLHNNVLRNSVELSLQGVTKNGENTKHYNPGFSGNDSIDIYEDSLHISSINVDNSEAINELNGREILISEDEPRWNLAKIFSIRDLYYGVQGKQNFWNEIFNFSLKGNSIIELKGSASTPQEINYTIKKNNNLVSNTASILIDKPLNVNPSITNTSIVFPTPSKHISGVPVLDENDKIIASYELNNVVSQTYLNNMSKISIENNICSSKYANPTIRPDNNDTTHWDRGPSNPLLINNVELPIQNNKFIASTELKATITAYAPSKTGSSSITDSKTVRVDSVSDESGRVRSGLNLYAPSDMNLGTYDSNTSLLDNGYKYELQLSNGKYIYPTENFLSISGPNYSVSTSPYRYLTKIINVPSNAVTNIRVTLHNHNLSLNDSDLRIEYSASPNLDTSISKWYLGTQRYISSDGNPTTIKSDGTVDNGGLVFDGSTDSIKNLTFGGTQVSITKVIVRVGLKKDSSKTFSDFTVEIDPS